MIFTTLESGTDPTTVDGLVILANLLKRSLRDELRLSAGGTYDPDASASTRIDRGYSFIEVRFQTAPRRAAELLTRAKAVIAQMRKEEMPPSRLSEAVLAQKMVIERSLSTNYYTAERIAAAAARGEDLDFMTLQTARFESFTPRWIQQAAIRYLDPNELSVFTLLPGQAR
jgi:predicted Zn-dependent peptidase